jgi:phosphoribosylaminoimidazolecarboxamide formyltransferase/IMP cyclohydrolase
VTRSWPLKYGLNPHQGDAVAEFSDGHEWLDVLNGQVGYINLLDALRAWTLARELALSLGQPGAASVKHVHPAGAAIAGSLTPAFRVAHGIGEGDLSPLATAYARARAGDRIAAFGDFIGLSHTVDESCARLIAREVSDGVIAPSYTPEALAILRQKKKGAYIILRADPAYDSDGIEIRRENGLELRQAPNRSPITASLFERRVSGTTDVDARALADLLLATIVVKHTPSNAICIAHDGQAIGVGGGQQARIHATRSACEKADLWRLQLHPRAAEVVGHEGAGRTAQFNLVRQWLLWDELSDRERVQLEAAAHRLPTPLTVAERREWLSNAAPLVMSSDGYIPFPDNVRRADRSGIRVVAQPGGSAQDSTVTAAADEAGIVMIHTGLRLFWH